MQRFSKLLIATTCTAMLMACGSGNHSPSMSNNVISDFASDPTLTTSSTSKIFIADQARPEGAAGTTTPLTFTLMLDPASDQTVTVDFTTIDGSATAGDDYIAQTGQVTFAAGEQTQTLSIDIIGDGTDEATESFEVVLSNPQHAELNQPAATGTVANDDAACTPPDPTADNPWLVRRIINFSHRGGAEEYPENTMYSYLKSVEIGAEVLEMDIFETADGELVVIHDASVDRTTDQTGSVSDYTLAELREMDAAFNFVQGCGACGDRNLDEYVFRGVATGDVPPPTGFNASDFKIPTLEEILQRFPNTLINIELKPDPDSTGSYELKLAELLLAYGRRDDVLVASFIDAPATNFKAAAPCISTSFPTAQAASYVIAGQGPSVMPGVSVHQAFQVPRSLGVEVVTQDFVDDAHDAGLAVHVFTINDCTSMVELLNLDVDAIMTDRPSLLEELLAQPAGTWSCEGLE